MIDTLENLKRSFWDMGSETAVNDCCISAAVTCAGVVALFRDVIDSECEECKVPVDMRDTLASAFAHGYLFTCANASARMVSP